MKENKNKYKYFKIIFIISVSIIFICFVYKIINSYIQNKYISNSDKLIDTYTLLSIYSDNNYDYSNSILLNSYPIIGKIEIPELNTIYPIISYSTEYYLKVAPCRFYGPSANQIGNMCIAGHNYNNNKFFSNINKLKSDSIIKIYDINNNCISYKVYFKDEVDEYNTSVLSQNTYNFREITLITCNNYNNKRIVVKAKETNF